MSSYLWVLASGGGLLCLGRARVIATVLILDLLLLGTSSEHGEDAVLHVGGSGGHGRSGGGGGIGGGSYYGLMKSACAQRESIKLERVSEVTYSRCNCRGLALGLLGGGRLSGWLDGLLLLLRGDNSRWGGVDLFFSSRHDEGCM